MLSVLRDNSTPGVLSGEPLLHFVGDACALCVTVLAAPAHLSVAHGLFAYRYGFLNNLTLGGPTPIGARKAPLSDKYLSMMQEVALNEQVSSAEQACMQLYCCFMLTGLCSLIALCVLLATGVTGYCCPCP